MSGLIQGNAYPIYFANGEQVGVSPKQMKQTIQWTGELWRGALEVKTHKWPLEKVIFNARTIFPSDPDARISDYHILTDVRNAIKKGDNVLTVHYKSPPSAFLGDKDTLLALLVVGDKIPGTGISTPTVTNIPSPELLAEQAGQAIDKATLPTIAIMAIIAVILIAIAVIASKLGVFGRLAS